MSAPKTSDPPEDWELIEQSCDKVYHLRDVGKPAHKAFPNAVTDPNNNWYWSACGLKLIRKRQDYLYPSCPKCRTFDV